MISRNFAPRSRSARPRAAGKVARAVGSISRGRRDGNTDDDPTVLVHPVVAVDHKIIDRNPAQGVKLAASGQTRWFLSGAEIRRLGEVLDKPAETPTAGVAAIVIRMLILTGARRDEIEALKWDEVDFEFSMLRLKTSKTGAKVIPLASVAINLLAEQRRRVSRHMKWVFQAQKGRGTSTG